MSEMQVAEAAGGQPKTVTDTLAAVGALHRAHRVLEEVTRSIEVEMGGTPSTYHIRSLEEDLALMAVLYYNIGDLGDLEVRNRAITTCSQPFKADYYQARQSEATDNGRDWVEFRQNSRVLRPGEDETTFWVNWRILAGHESIRDTFLSAEERVSEGLEPARIHWSLAISGEELDRDSVEIIEKSDGQAVRRWPLPEARLALGGITKATRLAL